MNALIHITDSDGYRYYRGDEVDAELARLTAENEALKNDLLQMTHNCVGAEMERDELARLNEQQRAELARLMAENVELKEAIKCEIMSTPRFDPETCEHCSGIVLLTIGRLSFVRCTWACGRVQVQWVKRNGNTVTICEI